MTEYRKPAPHGDRFPDKNAALIRRSTAQSTAAAGGFVRRRQAATRVAPLECGCPDPWAHRCFRPEPSETMIDAYTSTVEMLAALGYPAAPLVPELRGLWRRGDREAVSSVTSRWVI